MSSWRQIVLTVALVAVVAVVAVAANLALLRSTEDRGDPVGHLSPRAVFTGNGSSTVPAVSSSDGRHSSGTPDD